ncbi:hypothetical protein H7I53_18355 [Mycolicibacterium pulveris]|uniref:Uncharacterized protein n=1 Tax=Mycolicibacterium pulveris TaxID=36813 RepID=A0A7I7URS0_MYCPV|nr:hypothetical protein [Mycolicibacterium pulveris]MCV6982179.1 hypothetical protein [Mycolicibacterium pulveris]BBY84175.1 hypothetical protein MPUL_53330 [Mycolicibacterium pulveris]
MTDWLPIDGYPHHQVSADGRRVRSVDRIDGLGRVWRGQELKLFDPQPVDDTTAAKVRAGGGGPRCTIAYGKRRESFYPRRYVKQLAAVGDGEDRPTTSRNAT